NAIVEVTSGREQAFVTAAATHHPGIAVADVSERAFDLYRIKFTRRSYVNNCILWRGDYRRADWDALLRPAIADGDPIANLLDTTSARLCDLLLTRLQPFVEASALLEGDFLIFALLRFLNTSD